VTNQPKGGTNRDVIGMRKKADNRKRARRRGRVERVAIRNERELVAQAASRLYRLNAEGR